MVKVSVNGNKMPKEIIMCGIIALMVIEVVALFLGVNGTFRMTLTALIAAAIGITIPTPKVLGGNDGRGTKK